MLATAKRYNEFSLDENGDSPLEKFSGTKEKIMSTDWHTWGCPIFVLVEVNQSRLTSTSKWEPSARVGVYFGHLPVYARNIAFVLNLLTGHVSPQYHVVYDDEFTTADYLDLIKIPPSLSNLV